VLTKNECIVPPLNKKFSNNKSTPLLDWNPWFPVCNIKEQERYKKWKPAPAGGAYSAGRNGS